MPAVEAGRQLGFALRDALPWAGLAAVVSQGEGMGYRAVFLPEIAGRDALVTLGALAGETSELLLGTGVLPMDSRTPILTAMGAATVHERAGGRLILGLGTGSAAPGSLARLRELVGVLRRIFGGESVELGGRHLRLTLTPGSPPAIWMSALGPNAVRAAGEVADGVLLNWCPPERVARAREELAAGAAAAGRDPAEIRVAVYVRGSVGGSRSDSEHGLRVAAGEYASYPAYARQFAASGLGAEAKAAAAARAAGRPQDVPDTLIGAVCLTGGPAEGRARLQVYRDAGADLPIVYPVPAPGSDPASSVLATLGALAPGA